MPPSIASALHPIVLPPVPVPPYFTTLGAGLLHATQPRELPSTLHTLLFSHPPLANKDRPKSWWRAQCLLYGLDAPEKRTVLELRAMLQNAILQGGLRVPDAMQELEKRENGRFRKLNAEMREATGVASRGKAPPKDPLRGIRGQGAKVAKAAGRKPAARGRDVTVNVTVNLSNPQATKAQAKKTQPASRPKQTAKKGGAAPKTARSKGSAAPTQPATTSRAKQTAKRGGAAPKTARPKGSAAPKGRATTATRAEPIMARWGRGGGGALARDSGVADHQAPVEDEDEDPYGGGSDYGDYGFCGTRQFSDQGMYGCEEEEEEEEAAVAGSAYACPLHGDYGDYEDYEHHESYQGSDDYQGHDICRSW